MAARAAAVSTIKHAPSEQRKDVILAAVARLCDERQVRGQRAAVCTGASFVIRVRTRQTVRELARAQEHLALSVRTVLDVLLGGHGLELLLRVRNADKIAVRNQIHRVARGAYLNDRWRRAGGGGGCER